MSQGTEQHLEHAEHAKHAAHNPFDRQVAMTMAITAAALAGVAMVSHRGHNETLRLQSAASIQTTKASDQWNYYQAKNIASRQMQIALHGRIYPEEASRANPNKEIPMPAWAKEVKKYQGAPGIWVAQVDKYEGKGYWAEQVATNFQGDKTKGGKKIKGGQLAKLEKEARGYEEKAREYEQESHHVHAQVNWLDFGHLGLELSLVLSSVALLSKQRSFWLLGILVAVIGAGLAAYGVYGLYLAPAHVAGH